MRHAKIVEGCEWVFDWDKGKEALDQAYDEDSEEFNWGALARADPGATTCPTCQEFYWAEALELECPDCGTQWNTQTKEIIK